MWPRDSLIPPSSHIPFLVSRRGVECEFRNVCHELFCVLAIVTCGYNHRRPGSQPQVTLRNPNTGMTRPLFCTITHVGVSTCYNLRPESVDLELPPVRPSIRAREELGQRPSMCLIGKAVQLG